MLVFVHPVELLSVFPYADVRERVPLFLQVNLNVVLGSRYSAALRKRRDLRPHSTLAAFYAHFFRSIAA